MKYSLVLTTYNNGATLGRVLDIYVERLDPRDWEIVIVDNMSNDGTLRTIKERQERFEGLKVIRKKCLRGMGWHTGYEAGKGDYVVISAGDTIPNDTWFRIIDKYEKEKFDFALAAWFFQIYPRELLDRVKGWRNLNYWEDVELWSRLVRLDKIRIYAVPTGENIKGSPSSTSFEKTYRVYRKLHDKMLVATNVPFGLYPRAAWKKLKARRGTGAAIPRFLYYAALMTAAGIMSGLRRAMGDYGRYEDYMAAANKHIDLGLVPEDEVDSYREEDYKREDIIKAYRKGNYGFLPPLWD